MAHELEKIYFRQRSMINKLPHVLAQSVIIWALLQFPPNKKTKKNKSRFVLWYNAKTSGLQSQC